VNPTLPTSVQVLERRIRRTPFGLRVQDLATGRSRIEGLSILVRPAGRSGGGVQALANPSGIYVAAGLPGLADFEHDDSDSWPQSQGLPRTFQVEVRDPRGHFQPLRFDTPLPMRGLVDPLSASPPMPLLSPLEAPPRSPLEAPPVPHLPLFSTPSRPPADALALVRAELREHPSQAPAAWALLEVRIGGSVRGLGLADAAGRVAVQFPYPPSPRAGVTSPASPRDDFRWDIELHAYHGPRQPDAPPPEMPALADLLARLAEARRPLLDTLSPALPLGPLPLQHGSPTVARTWRSSGEPSPYLFIDMT